MNDEKLAERAVTAFWNAVTKTSVATGRPAFANIIVLEVPSHIAQRMLTLLLRDAKSWPMDGFTAHLEDSPKPGMTKVVGGHVATFAYEAEKGSVIKTEDDIDRMSKQQN